VLSVTMKKNDASSGKVAKFWKFELALWFRQIAVYFCWIGGEASSGPGNTELRNSKNDPKSIDFLLDFRNNVWLCVHTNSGDRMIHSQK
jgi:hypothetical protein